MPILASNGNYVDLSQTDWGEGEAAAQFVAIYEDGRACIAKPHAREVAVRRLLDKAEQNLGIPLQREYLTLDEIAEARKAGIAGRRGDANARMQQNILDVVEQAHTLNASDIHIDVEEQVTSVKMRIDGRLFRTATWTREHGLRFLGAAYAMADIADGSYSPANFLRARLAPREGRDEWAFPAGLEAVRMQFNPKAFGVTYAVFRLLGTVSTSTTLEDLGYEPEQLDTLSAFASRSKGMAIIAGPTGSGKSTTLSAQLIQQRRAEALSGRERTLFTIEDPPERRLPGAQQLAVPNTDTDEERDIAFSNAIRAAMRSDPDVLMIGEIRDRITANLAASSSITGHQVLSTLHCSTAHAVPLRLIDLGVDPSIIFGSDELQVAVAQVLAPKLCVHCRVPLASMKSDQAALFFAGNRARERAYLASLVGPGAMVEGDGCDHCRRSGIRGRTVLAEVIRTDPEYLKTLREQGIVAAREFCRDRGELSIADVALRKAQRGEISATIIPELMEIRKAVALAAVS